MDKSMTKAQSRWIIEQEIYKLRCLQLGSDMSDSDLFSLIAKTFNVTGGQKEAEQVLSLVVKLKARERISDKLEP